MFSETSSGPKDRFILQRLYTRKKLTPFDAIANSFRACSDCFALADFTWLGESPGSQSFYMEKSWPGY